MQPSKFPAEVNYRERLRDYVELIIRWGPRLERGDIPWITLWHQPEWNEPAGHPVWRTEVSCSSPSAMPPEHVAAFAATVAEAARVAAALAAAPDDFVQVLAQFGIKILRPGRLEQLEPEHKACDPAPSSSMPAIRACGVGRPGLA